MNVIQSVPMNDFGKKQKVGRNDSCPCGSGKKFKKCHGLGAPTSSAVHAEPLPDIVKKVLEQQKAAELQREKQQGFGKPIISTFCNGQRFVAVKDKIFHSPKWKTFHDFLHDYITPHSAHKSSGVLWRYKKVKVTLLNTCTAMRHSIKLHCINERLFL